jgi:hypothetical protein
MNTRFQKPLQLQIKPSRLLKQTLLGLHCLALFAIWVSAIPLAVKALLTILVIYNGQKVYKGKTRFDKTHWLNYSSGQGWQIAGQDLDFQTITILPSTVVTPWLTVIHYQIKEQSRLSLVVNKDALTPENYRQLIVKLKVKGIKPE